ncbi:MAG: ATP synthase F1 subunit gamma [Puniceicoccaceae bacterium]|nr:MAG: ATP synthase F1 subunit gamma [Puniceicoccaceae bacterium]
MPSTRDIRRRIKSVKNTRQITKAMELVAASKMKKAQQAALAGRPYALLLADILASISTRVEEVPHPFLIQREVKRRGILVVTTDKGLCGPLNSNMFRVLTELQDEASFVSIGRKGTQFLGRTRRSLLADFSVDDTVPFAVIRQIAEFLIQQYLEGHVDTVEILYPRFVNTLVQEPTLLQLLPLESLEAVVAKLRAAAGRPEATLRDDRQMLFEPNMMTVLDQLLPLFIKQEIHQCVLDAKASEHSARMVAMKTAKDNASNLLDDLTLEYNKARQAAITQEILEIAAATASNA